MATAKKKPTPAQLAARKLFAERARAGTLGKKPAKKTTARKKNPISRSVKNSRALSTSRHRETVADWRDHFQVQVKYTKVGKWEHIGGGLLKTKREAEAFAHQLHRLNPEIWIRVVTPE